MVRANFSVRMMLCMLGAIGGMAVAVGASQAQEADKRVAIDLIADKRVAAPGQKIWVALRQKIAPGWHTYWSNPGDSGEATRIAWKLPDGFSASHIRWPIPEAIPVGPLLNHGYSDEVLLLTEITVPQSASGAVTLRADANWLVCKEICIPEEGTASVDLSIGTPAQMSEHAAAIGQAVTKLSKPLPWRTTLAVDATTARLTIVDAALDPTRIARIRFFPNEWGGIAYAPEQPVTWSGNSPTLTLTRGDLKDKPLVKLSGLLVIEEKLEGAPVRHGFEVQTVAVTTAGGASPLGLASAADGGMSLWQAVLFALIGGVILNLMPCVFPVLSLKALALAKLGSEQVDERRRQGLAYVAGVLASFAVLTAVLVGLRAAGLALGWGFQFQSPLFVLAMAALFFALGLSMLGVFLIGTSVTNVGSGLAGREGTAGSFFTGVLASVAATPCTAPFMGAAVGFALTQPAIVAGAVVMALGLGFALPLFCLSTSSTLARLLPKPGRWMETLKQALAFPLYASAGWMVWVLSIQSGSPGVLAAVVVLLAVAFVAWLLGEPSRAGVASKVAAAVILFASAAGAYRLVDTQSAPFAGSVAMDSGAEPFTQQRLDALVQEGRPVFVNFTAAWCITCKVNEQVALTSAAFRKALRDGGIAYLKGDWTSRNPEITALLERFGRAGVPLYLFYDGKGGAPHVLPQILTEAMVLERLATTAIAPKITSNGDQS
jgi:thiol:disulfide interchange protein/DsbC/DsbD-like thiol-disulfide interchange protein